MDSALQIVLYQRFLEDYGGARWTFESLPLVVSYWLAANDINKDIQRSLARMVRDGMSLSEAFNKVMGQLGAKASRNLRLARAVQKVLTGDPFRLFSNRSPSSKYPNFYMLGPPACHRSAYLRKGR